MRLILLILACAEFAYSQPILRAEVSVIGPVEYGQPTKVIRYSGHPRYQAFEFNAKPGDQIEAIVESKQGRMRAILTDSQFRTLAGGSNHFSARLPSRGAPASYFILVSEENRHSAQYTLDLERPSAAPAEANKPRPEEYLSCVADSDCVAVDRAGCCHNGWKDAVNSNRIGAYMQANPCRNPRPICPMYIVNDQRQAVCNVSSGRCEMVERRAKQ